ncbi:MAG: DUF1080 domain-containing protein [Candidatus Krumholzibacteria bacterium]|nr:DUF1080 domain-containing protein [Candidatus Krumholzibacteria bacterium]
MNQDDDGSTSLLEAGATVFEDNFDSGIDTDVWYLETAGNVQWAPATEEGNGYISSPPQSPYDWSNRYTDILTCRDNFDDFEMTFDLRMHTESWHKDQRFIYIRSENNSYPYGYNIYFSSHKPTDTPPNFITIYKTLSDYTPIYISPVVEFNWILGQWYTFRVYVCGTQIKVKVWLKNEFEPADWTIEGNDSENQYLSGRIGFGDYWGSITDVDNVRISSLARTVDLDIKPGSCPNPFNPGSTGNGVLPAAILGTTDFDVTTIDVSSITLEGIIPLHSELEDVSAPAETDTDCECSEEGPDGLMDLTIKFSTFDVIQLIGEVVKGDIVTLTISGVLLDGTPFEGIDCICIVGPKATKIKTKT